jgi:multidrug efflux system membrane fusion protein
LDNAKVQLDFCTITSPLTGRIGLRQVDPGNYVQTSDANGLAVITQIQPIAVIFTIADVDIPKIMGDSSTVPNLEADAYSSDFSEKLGVGYLAAVDSQIDPTTAKLKLKAAFDNKDNALFPNQFVNIQLLTRTVHGAVIIPQAAVQRGPDNSTFVYVVKTDGTDHSVEVRNITLGPQAGDSQVVRSGLAAGETIVTDGVDRLLDGSKVTPTEMAAPATQPTTGHHHHHHNSEDESSGAATTRTAE